MFLHAVYLRLNNFFVLSTNEYGHSQILNFFFFALVVVR